jgi:hypothetical protein
MGLLKRQGWPLLGVAEVRPRPKIWMPDGGSCGGLDESWQSDQIVAGHRAKRVRRGLGFRIEYGLEGRPQPQDGCASEREGAGALKRVIPRT